MREDSKADSARTRQYILRAVLESPRDIVIFALDTEYRYLAFNEAHRRTMAAIWQVEVAIGQCMLDVIGREDDRAKAKANFDRSLAGEHFVRIEEYGQEGASRRYYEDVYSPIVAADGAVIGLTLFLSDITEQTRAQRELEDYRVRLESLVDERTAALRRSEELYRTLVVNASIAVMVHRDGKLIFANPAASALCGSPQAAQLEGRALTSLFRDAGAALASPAAAPVELSLTRADGTQAYVEWTALAVDVEGGPATLALAVDISARKEAEIERQALEEQLRHRQKLESLGLLAGGITHDFNNLLVGILGNAELALRAASATSEVRMLLGRIKTAAVRASELTGQLLAYSGKGVFHVSPLDLSSVVHEMSALMNVSVPGAARLVLDLGEELPAFEGNGAQIRQVVMNLITNAADAVGEGDGTIMLRTTVVDADRELLSTAYVDDALEPGQYLCLEVSDNGAGMDEVTLTRLFDPFFTTKAKGRGLGLAATLGIVRSHAGAISVASTPGLGSTVRVFLPRSHRPASSEAIAPLEGWRATGTVLIADDEPRARQVLSMMLDDIGFEVIEAATTSECLDLYRKHAGSIDVIMLDLVMPGGGGRQVVRVLREEGYDVPIVLSSGYSEEAIGAELRADPHLAFLDKPYEYATFVRVMQTAMATPSARTSAPEQKSSRGRIGEAVRAGSDRAL